MADEDFVLDLNELTMGDLETIEKIAGVNVSKLFAEGGMTAKAMIAAVYVSRKKVDPGFTLDDARQVQVSVLNTAAPDPKDGSA